MPFFAWFFGHFETAKQIGCSDWYFTTGSSIAKRISRQMDEHLISETSGLNFEWWCIWERQPNYRYVDKKKNWNKNAVKKMCPFNWKRLNCVRYTLTFCNKIQLNIDIHLEHHEANVMRMHPIKRAPAKMITKRIIMTTKKKGKFFPKFSWKCDENKFSWHILMSHASMRIKFSTLFDNLPIFPCICRTNDDLIEEKPIEEPSKPIEEHAHRHHHGDETVRICQSLSCGLHLSCYLILFFFWNVVRLKYFLLWKSFHGNENQSKIRWCFMKISLI